jgi:hypothetical protein
MGREASSSKRRREAERSRCVKKLKTLDEHCSVIHSVSSKGHFSKAERHSTSKLVNEVELEDFERLSLAASIDGDPAGEAVQTPEEPQEESPTQVRPSRIINHKLRN